VTLADDLERARAAWQQLGADLRAALVPSLRRLLEWLEPPQTARNRAEADAGLPLTPIAPGRAVVSGRTYSRLEPGVYSIAPDSPIAPGGTLHVDPPPPRQLWHTYEECGGRCPEHARGF